MKDIKMDYRYTANISLGEFKFGSSITQYLEDFKHDFTPSDSATGWDNYSFKYPEIDIYTEEDEIISIRCEKHFFWKKKDLIEMHISDFIDLAKEDPDEVEDIFVYDEEHPQIVYGFEKIGLQIWTRDNKIITVLCADYEDDEDSIVGIKAPEQ